MRPNGFSHLRGIDEEDRGGRQDDSVCEEDGVERDIGPAEAEQPGNLVGHVDYIIL